LICVTLTATVCGQTAAADRSTESVHHDGQPLKLDPLVVTTDSNAGYGALSSSSSSRLNLKYIDVPQTVSVLTSEFLEDAYLFDSRDFTKYVNGVTPLTNTHRSQVMFIRGLETTAAYVDGFLGVVAMPRDAAFYDRVEYVKGPASAAIGRGEAGGLINYVAKKPLGISRFTYRATVGTDEFYRFEGDFNRVLDRAGKVALRIPLYYQDSDGERGGSRLHTEKRGIAPSLSWKISDRTDTVLTVALSDNSIPGAIASAHWLDPYLVAMSQDLRRWNPAIWMPGPTTPYPSRDNVYTFEPNYRRTKAIEATWHLTHRFNDHFSFRQGVRAERSVENVRRYASPPTLSRVPSLPSGIGVNITMQREYTKDEGLRSQSDLLYEGNFLHGSHTALIGLDVYGVSGEATAGSRGGLQLDFYNPVNTYPAGFDPETYAPVSSLINRVSGGDGYGYYGQYHGKFVGERLQVIVGWRQDRTSTWTRNRTTNARAEENATTDVPRVSVSYKPRDWLTTYYLYSEQADPPIIRAKRSGPLAFDGATLPDLTTARWTEQVVGQVAAKLHEVGAKAELMGGRLVGSVAYFKLTRDGFLQPVVKLEPGANGIGQIQFNEFFTNEGEKVEGVEIEGFGRPTKRLTLMYGLVFQNGTKPREDGRIQKIERVGDTYMLHGKYSLRNDRGNGFELTAGGKMWAKGFTLNSTSFVEYGKDQYSLDAGVSYYWRSGRYGLHFRVNNLLDDMIILTENSQFNPRRSYLSFSGRF